MSPTVSSQLRNHPLRKRACCVYEYTVYGRRVDGWKGKRYMHKQMWREYDMSASVVNMYIEKVT